jgi:hypothetical protein
VTTALLEVSAARRTSEALGMLPTMLTRRLGRDCRVRALDHRPSECRSSFAIEEIDVLLEGGELLRLVLKSVGPRGLLPGARMSKPLFLHDPLREIEFHQHVLSGRPELGTAVLYSSVVEPAQDRYWLLFERVFGSTLEGTANLDRWRAVARWLARLHVNLAPLASEALAPGTARLLRYGPDFLRMWIARAVATVRIQHPVVPRELILGIERLAGRYDGVIDRLMSMPQRIIHGEFYPSNILVNLDSPHPRIAVLDWEMVAVGPPMMDLAALLASERDEARVRDIALTYRSALPDRPIGDADHRHFLEDLAFCKLHLAVQWLGWSPDVSPPRRQAHAWIADVLRLADELDV